MKKTTTVLTLIALFTVLALSACGVLQEPQAASGTIEAIPLETQSAGVVVEATEPALEAAPTDMPTVEAVEATAEATPPAQEPTETPAEAPAETSATTVYTIDPAGSQVRFELDEDLRGVRTTVVGITDQVAGQLSLNLGDLSQTQVGIIQINARTLVTDNTFRNRAIQNEILDTGAFEFITFTPTGIEGLPASAALGEPVTFTITGDLTIRDVTLPATFTVEATADSDRQVTGTATAVVNRADYGLQIPSVPNVANVEEEVDLFIDFTANAS